LNVLLIVVGVALVLVALSDAFLTLFRPVGFGMLSWWLTRGIWDIARLTRSARMLSLAGPFGVLCVIFSWLVLVTIGWALVIWTFLPEDFVLVEGLAPAEERGFVDALYVSLTALTTLGFGDLAPLADVPRILVVLEGLIGLMLLTASISWLLTLTPAIGRARRLAHTAHALWRTDFTLGDPDATATIDALAEQVRSVESDLLEQPLTFYFRSSDPRHSLPNALEYLLSVVGTADQGPTRRLRVGIEELAATVGQRKYLGGPPSIASAEILARYVAAQRWRPWQRDSTASGQR
jgi:hypothetical protein